MYSIKTDMGVSGNATIGKDLLVQGNAVLKNNLTVEGTVTFADAVFTKITTDQVVVNNTLDVTGKTTLKGGMEVRGNSIIGSSPAGSDTVTVNSNASFNGTASFAGDITQTAGKTILQNTKVANFETTGTTTFGGDVSANSGTTATFDTLNATNANVSATLDAVDINSTGTATFNDVTINGTLGGTFALGDVTTDNLVVNQLSNLKGAVILGSNITGANTLATFKEIKMGDNTASQNFKISFTYTAPTLRPTVLLQNEIQSELMSPSVLNVLKTATFGNESAATYGITGKGLNKLDYLTISGNSVQDPTTPRLEVTAGKTKLVDLDVSGASNFTGLATFDDLTVNGTLSGNFSFNNINADSLTVTGLTDLRGAVSLGANITGTNTQASFKEIKMGANAADQNVKIGFTYTDPNKRPTVLLQNEIQSEVMSPAVLNVLKTATFGNESATTYGITGKGLNTFDYITLTGNAIQDPDTPVLQVSGQTNVQDLDISGTLSGNFSIDLTGKAISVESVDASSYIKGNSLESTTTLLVGTDATVTRNLTVGGKVLNTLNATNLLADGTLDVTGISTLGTANITAANASTLNVSGTAEIDGDLTANADVILNGVTPGSQTATGGTGTVYAHNLYISGDTNIKATADVDGADIKPNSVETTTTLKANGATTLTSVTASGLATLNGGVTTTDINTATLTATGTSTLAAVSSTAVSTPSIIGTGTGTGVAALEITGDTHVAGTFTADTITLSGDLEVDSLTVDTNATVNGNLTVVGGIDLTQTDVVAKSLTSTGIITVQDIVNPSVIPVLSNTKVQGTLNATGATTLDSTLAVTGNSQLANASVGGTLGVTGITTLAETTVNGDMTVTGTLNATVDLSGRQITMGDLTLAADADTGATGTITVGGAAHFNDVLNSTSIINTGTISSVGFTSTGGATITNGLSTDTLDVTSDFNGAGGYFSGDLTVDGTLTGNLDLTGKDLTLGSLVVNTDGGGTGNVDVAGNLTVSGTVDFSLVDLTTKTITNTGNYTSALGNITLTSGKVTSSTLQTVGAATFGNSVTVAGNTQLNGNSTVIGNADTDILTVNSTSTFSNDVTVNGTFTPAGGLDLGAADLSINSLTTAAGITSTGVAALNGGITTTTMTATGDVTVKSITAGTFESLIPTLNVSTELSVGGTATFSNADETFTVLGNASFGKDLTVDGTLIPSGGLDLTNADVSAKSLTTSGTLSVTGNSTLSTLSTSGLATLNSLAVTGNASIVGTLDVTGALGGTSIKASTSLISGTVVGTHTEALQIFGAGYISGDLIVDGTINADIDVSGQTLEPFAVEATDHLSTDGNISAVGNITGGSATLGTAGGTNNVLTANGNVVTNGNFTVTGTLTANLDQSQSDVIVKSLHSNSTVDVDTILTVTGNSVLSTLSTSGKATMASAEVTGALTVGTTLGVTGLTSLSTLTTTGLATLNSAVINTTLTVTGAATFNGDLTANGNTVIGDAATDTLVVNATPEFKENVTFDKDINVTGALNMNEISTKKYSVVPQQVTASAVGATWTPDGNNNVYYITLDQATTNLAPVAGLIGGGKSSSIFIYVQQDSTGNRDFVTDPSYALVGGTLNKTAGSVTIYQMIYDGFSNVVDMFIAQRTA